MPSLSLGSPPCSAGRSCSPSPGLRSVIPFGEDPYDAVGSFGTIVGMLVALVFAWARVSPLPRSSSVYNATRVPSAVTGGGCSCRPHDACGRYGRYGAPSLHVDPHCVAQWVNGAAR